MNVCSNCGRKLPTTSVICLFCGFNHGTGRQQKSAGSATDVPDRARGSLGGNRPRTTSAENGPAELRRRSSLAEPMSEAQEESSESDTETSPRKETLSSNLATIGCVTLVACLIVIPSMLVIYANRDSVERWLATQKPPDEVPEPELPEARRCEEVWHSSKRGTNQQLFAPPFYYVQATDSGKRFVAPAEEWPSATTDLAVAKTVVIFEVETASESYGTFGIETLTLDDARVKLNFCFVDAEDWSRIRWIKAESAPPKSVKTDRSGTTTTGGLSFLDETLLPKRLGLVELFVETMKRATGFADASEFKNHIEQPEPEGEP